MILGLIKLSPVVLESVVGSVILNEKSCRVNVINGRQIVDELN